MYPVFVARVLGMSNSSNNTVCSCLGDPRFTTCPSAAKAAASWADTSVARDLSNSSNSALSLPIPRRSIPASTETSGNSIDSRIPRDPASRDASSCVHNPSAHHASPPTPAALSSGSSWSARGVGSSTPTNSCTSSAKPLVLPAGFCSQAARCPSPEGETAATPTSARAPSCGLA